jgi:hypothetical protein
VRYRLLCQDIVAPGGVIPNIGVHGTKVDLHLERLWSSNIAITTRLVDTVTKPMLLKTVQSKKIDPQLLITHRFKLNQILDAYDTRRRRYSLAPDPHWKEPNHGSGYLRKLHGAARGRAQIGLSGVGCGEFSEANPRIGRGNFREPNFPVKTED